MSTFVACMIKPFGSQHMEELDSSKEINDINDPYAMSVMTGREVVGHVPYKISRVSVTNGRNVKCTSCNRKPWLFSDESFKFF